MTLEQKHAVAIAKRLAGKLGRRPLSTELHREGIAVGRRQAFMSLHALLVAADLAFPAPRGRAGFTPAEEHVLLRLWEAGETAKAIAKALGVIPRILGNEIHARRLTRKLVRRPKGDPLILTRRCQEPGCGKITEGAGPCRHCGAEGLTSAA